MESQLRNNSKGDQLNKDAAMNDALTLLSNALDLLDRTEAPADVGAHVDLAIHRLQAALAARNNASGQVLSQMGPSTH